MGTLTLNETIISYNNIYYISVTGNDMTGDGTKSNPFASYDKAYSKAITGDLIYFIKGNYIPTTLYNGSNSYNNSYIYDNIGLTIYAERDTYITINNPSNVKRDTHFASLTNNKSIIIGFIVDYYVTNKSSNYSRSLVGSGDVISAGYIYNCHFIIRSKTSFSYANKGTSLKYINCQFNIQVTPENAYSGNTTFEKCLINIASISSSAGFIGTDNKYNITFDSKYKQTTLYNGYGVYAGIYRWIFNAILFKDSLNNIYNYNILNNQYINNGIFDLKNLTDINKNNLYNITQQNNNANSLNQIPSQYNPKTYFKSINSKFKILYFK